LATTSAFALRYPRHHIADDIVKQLRLKMSIDLQARDAIRQEDQYKYDRLKQIELKIQTLNLENQLKIQQMNKIESTLLKKIEKELSREREIE
jgi:hypothetical protein